MKILTACTTRNCTIVHFKIWEDFPVKDWVRLALCRLPLGLTGSAVALLLLTNPASALVVAYENLSSGYDSNSPSSLGTNTRGLRFTSAASGRVESVLVPLGAGGSGMNVAEFSLYTSTGSQPDGGLQSIQVDTAGTGPGGALFNITGWDPEVFLETGVEYWLVGRSVGGDPTWYATNDTLAPGDIFVPISGSNWVRTDFLSGATITVSPVPVPPAALLFLSALAALGLVMRRRAHA